MAVRIEIAFEVSRRGIRVDRLRRAARAVLEDHGRAGTLSVAVVGDETIHRLNREYLGHDHPTDCLSFDLTTEVEGIETIGEVVVSAETARREAARRDLPFEDELTRYVVHATLHLVGYDDDTPAARRKMRARERKYLDQSSSPGRSTQR